MSEDFKTEKLIHTGSNFMEMLNFCGKSANFGKWFSSDNEFVEYCKKEGGLFKLFDHNGKYRSAYKGDMLVKKTNSQGRYTITVVKGKNYE